MTPVTRDGAPLAPQPHATVNYSELLTHLLPQSAYIVDRAGRPTCHSVFTIATLRAAGLPRENAQEELYNGSRPATRALLRRGTPLGERVRRLYAQDVQLWQRQLEGRPPTAAARVSPGAIRCTAPPAHSLAAGLRLSVWRS